MQQNKLGLYWTKVSNVETVAGAGLIVRGATSNKEL